MAESNLSYSVDNSYSGTVLPDAGISPMNLAMKFSEMNEQRRLKQEQLNKEKQAHTNAMQKHFGSMFDATKYHTGTDLDQVINQKASDSVQEMYKFIKDNPDASDTDIQMLAQQRITPLVQLKTVGKKVTDYIDITTESLKNDKGINAGAVKAYAKHDAMYKKDESGKLVLKSPEEIDEDLQTHNYVTEAMQKYDVLFGDGGFNEHINSFKPSSFGGVNQTDYAGLNNRSEWAADIFPYQQIQKDKNGNVTGVALRKEKSVIGDVIPEDVYNDLQGKPGTVAYISRAVKKWADDNKTTISPNTPEYHLAARHILVDELEKKSAKKFTTKYIQNEDSWRGKMDAGITVNMGGSAGGKAGKDGSVSINDVAGRIKTALDRSKSAGFGFTAANKLDGEAFSVVLSYLNGKDKDLPPSMIGLKENDNGEVQVFKLGDKNGRYLLTTLPPTVGISKQIGAPEKRAYQKKVTENKKETKKPDPLGIL